MNLERQRTFDVLANSYFPLEKRQDLRRLFERTAVSLCDSIFKSTGPTYWFTDHGPNHSDAVLYYALALASRASQIVGHLSPEEAMALASSCYLHDLAMAYVPDEYDLSQGWTQQIIDKVRHEHVLGVDQAIERNRESLKDLFEWEPLLEAFVPLICKAHGSESYNEMCEQLRLLSTSSFRGDLLGKILLLADEMDITHHRAQMNHPQFEQFPHIAKAHMFKHHYTIEATPDLPRFKVLFSFPDDLPQSSAQLFQHWVISKFKIQIELITHEGNPEHKQIFDIHIELDQRQLKLHRSSCPDDVLQTLASMASSFLPSTVFPQPSSPREMTLARPNQFHPERLGGQKQGPFYPILDRLMDGFFRTLTTPEIVGSIKDTYIRTEENDKVADNLARAISSFAASFRKKEETVCRFPFLITGGIGVGKSSLIEYVLNAGKIKSRYDRENAQLVVFVDCLNAKSFENIQRTMLSCLWRECSKDEFLLSQLRKRKWKLTESQIEILEDEPVERNLNGLLVELKTGFSFSRGERKTPIPVCFILDNLDRTTGFEIKKDTVNHATTELYTKGFPFFVITLRYPTKVEIEVKYDHLPYNPTNPIQAIDSHVLLERRFQSAFSSEALAREDGWCEKQVFDAQLYTYRLKFEDFRESLKTVIETLAGGSQNYSRKMLLPSLAATNMRKALTLFRAILKSVNIREFMKLMTGVRREHYLITCAPCANMGWHNSP